MGEIYTANSYRQWCSIMFEPITIAAAAIPLLTDGGKALIDIIKARFAPDELRPTSVADAVQLADVKIRLFQAMNAPGGESYPWVEAIIKLQRPLVVAVIMAIWAQANLSGGDTAAADNAASAVGFYLFADRTLFYTRKAAK